MFVTEREMKMSLGLLPAPSMVAEDHFAIDLDPDGDGRYLVFTKHLIDEGPISNLNAFEWVLWCDEHCRKLNAQRTASREVTCAGLAVHADRAE